MCLPAGTDAATNQRTKSEIHCSIPAVEYFRIRTLGCRIACDAEAGIQHGGPGVSGRTSHHQQGHHLREQLLPGHCTGRRSLLLRLFSPNRHGRGRCTAAAGIASPLMSLFIPDCLLFCDERAINNVLFTESKCKWFHRKQVQMVVCGEPMLFKNAWFTL